MQRTVENTLEDNVRASKYDIISQQPIGTEAELSDGVIARRLKNDEDGNMLFKICMEKGGLIGSNYHDFAEDMVLYKGKILEVVSNTVISDNRVLRLKCNQLHSLYALEDSVIYAQLNKPK